jgi:HSP20 family protein
MDMSRRNNPFDEIEQLFDRMRQQFEEAAGTIDNEVGALEGVRQGMKVDVEDTGDGFVVTADLPGYEKSDIDVRLADDRLRISAERDEESTDEGSTYLRRERRRSHAERTVRLPEPVDESSVSASYRNGVLTVDLRKTEPSSHGKDIEIE